MKSCLLGPGIATYAMMSRLLLLPHVLPALDGRFVGYLAAWALFHEVEDGECLVFGVFDGLCRPLGMAFGYPEGTTFVTHLVFERHVDTVAGCRAAIAALEENRPEMERITAEVPEQNRAVRVLMRKLGFAPTGREGRGYLAADGEWYPTQEFEYKLKGE